MGYARIVQYADVVEWYEYEKNYVNVPRKQLTELDKKRRLEARKLRIYVPKSKFSVKRAKTNFFQIVAGTLHEKGRPVLLTLTMHEDNVSVTKGYQYIHDFKKRLIGSSKLCSTFTYIAVPEFQKRGRLHFHLLTWGLPIEVCENERNTRNIQRQYGKGFVDVRVANDSSPKLASYLAKYMSKTYQDERLVFHKAYTCSRDVAKTRSYGSNTLTTYSSELIPDDACIQKIDSYNTQYMGRCSLTKYKIKN